MIGGVNRLPPVGLIVFSVGATGGAGGGVVAVVVVVVVVVVVGGASSASRPQAAVKPTVAMIATPPAMTGRRRAKRPDLMMQSYLCPVGSRFATSWLSDAERYSRAAVSQIVPTRAFNEVNYIVQ